MKSNIFDTALIFEGGGMRGSYSAGVLNTLLENEIYFDKIYGVSAGSSHCLNYMTRDQWRAKESFVGFADDPNFGSIKTFLQGKGLFNAEYIYQHTSDEGEALPLNLERFWANPADLCIASFQRDTGKTVFWRKEDMHELKDIISRVQASSSLPIVMPPTTIDGIKYYDGGLGEGAGILLDKAIEDGFEKFFIVRTRKPGYRKSTKAPAYTSLFWRRPHLREALKTRGFRYNEVCDKMEKLESEGRAYIVYADKMSVDSGTSDVALLEQSYQDGYAQAQAEVQRWKEFLNI